MKEKDQGEARPLTDVDLQRFAMPIHEVIKEMYFNYIAGKNTPPRYLIISQDIERELFRHFEESLRPDSSIRHSKFMEMEILVRPMGKNKFIDLAA